MKKLFTVFFLVLYLIFSPSTTHASDFSFKISQSYELKDLILYFAKDTKNISWGVASKTDNNILWETVESNEARALYPRKLMGNVGILINGVGRTKMSQSINDNGEIIKTIENYGHNGTVVIFAKPYWNPMMLSLGLGNNLPELSKLFNDEDMINMFWNYLENQGFTVTKLWKKGYLSWGETAAVVSHPETNDMYVICRTSSGASGIISSAGIRIFKNIDDMNTDSNFYGIK